MTPNPLFSQQREIYPSNVITSSVWKIKQATQTSLLILTRSYFRICVIACIRAEHRSSRSSELVTWSSGQSDRCACTRVPLCTHTAYLLQAASLFLCILSGKFLQWVLQSGERGDRPIKWWHVQLVDCFGVCCCQATLTRQKHCVSH